MTAPARDTNGRRALAIAGLLAFAVRLAIILSTPDIDTDSYGHFRIARALLADPTNLGVHWVWLPGYHYAVWALLHLGLTFTGLRVLSALVQAAAPFLLHDLVARRGSEDPARSHDIAFLAALALTFAPLSNRLATSAQAETLFTFVVLATAWALERRRNVLAGMLLTGACLMRYEAWGAIAALAVHRFWKRRDREPALVTFMLPALAVIGWIVLRRRTDGEWLAFFRHTHAFASGVRAAQGLSPLIAILPIFTVLGPAVLLVPVGVSRSIRAGWAVPAGILAFLIASYAGGGALGLERYFTALIPFACVAIADGAMRAPEIAKWLSARSWVRVTMAALVLTTAAHEVWMVRRARQREAELRGYEAAAMR